MKIIKELFSENSPISMLRLLSLISVLAAVAIAAFGIYAGRDLMGLAALCAVFITAAFGGKVLQKNMERKDQ
jgi:hypothetical protein